MFDQKAYSKQYNLSHKEQQSDYAKNYYHEHKEKCNKTSALWQQNHKDRANEFKRKWKEANLDEVKVQDKKTAVKLKTDILFHYSGGEIKCARCGITDTDVLCLDHVDGGGNKQRKELQLVGGSGFYRWLRTNDYPEGFQVLCANCNLKKRIREHC